MVIAGIALGLYVGVWLMFVGGILDIVAEIKGELELMPIGIGIVKMIFASFVGWVSAAFLIVPGMVLVGAE